MHGTTPYAFSIPPLSDTFLMKFTETLQPTHLRTLFVLLKANRTFGGLLTVGAETVLFRGVVDYHACGLAAALLEHWSDIDGSRVVRGYWLV